MGDFSFKLVGILSLLWIVGCSNFTPSGPTPASEAELDEGEWISTCDSSRLKLSDEKVASLKAEVEGGSARAAYSLYVHYSIGCEDGLSGIEWLARAAVLGLPHAEHEYGYHILIHGPRSDQELAKGMYWFKKSAEHGNTTAALELVSAYLTGEYGIAKDKAKAIVWTNRAAELLSKEFQNWGHVRDSSTAAELAEAFWSIILGQDGADLLKPFHVQKVGHMWQIDSSDMDGPLPGVARVILDERVAGVQSAQYK